MTRSIPCSEVQAHLPLFVGGDLETPLGEVVAAHLGGCRVCTDRLEALEQARGALLSLADVPGFREQVDLWPGVRARLTEEGVLGSPLASAGRSGGGDGAAVRRAPILRFALPFASAAAAAVLALLVWRPALPVEGQPDVLSTPASGATVRLAVDDSSVPQLIPVAGRLRAADPDQERLRAGSRLFPVDGRLMRAGQRSGGVGLSPVSNERLR